MKAKRIASIIIMTLITVCAFALAACGKKNDGGETEFGFPEYEYQNPSIPQKDWRELPADEGMTIDGRFTESVYDDLIPLTSQTVIGGNTYGVSLRAYLGVSGVYFKAEIASHGVYYNTSRELWNNSSLIIHVNQSLGSSTALGKNTIQARISVNGNAEQWIGLASRDGYEYTRVFFPMTARVVVKKDVEEVPYAQYGDVNLPDATGYDVEVFIPYASFGLEAAPDEILVMPEINISPSFSEGRQMIQFPGTNHTNPGGWLFFNSLGYSKHGAVVADGAFTGTTGWVYDAGDDHIVQTGGTDQKLYVNVLPAAKYYFEVSVTAQSVLNNDNYPKFGIMAAENDVNRYCYFVDPLKALTQKQICVVDRNSANVDWTWGTNDAARFTRDVPSISYTGGGKVKMAVARDGADFYFFIDGKLVKKASGVRGFGAADPSEFGLYTMNLNAKYTDWYSTVDSDEVDAKIVQNRLVFAPPAKLIYEQGEAADYAGSAVARIDDGGAAQPYKTSFTAEGVSVDGFSTAAIGTVTVTVTVDGVSFSYEIQVVPVLVSATVSTAPTNLTVRIGEPYAPQGGKLTLAYSEGDPAEVDITAEMCDVDTSSSGSKTVTVTYGSKTATFNITVEGTMGDSPYESLAATAGFDISADTGATPSVTNGETSASFGDQFIYFAGLNSTEYMFSVKIMLNKRLNGDAYPKIGVIASARADGKKLLMLVDPGVAAPASANKDIRIVNNVFGGWNWDGASFRTGLSTIDYTVGLKLSVIKKGGEFWFLYDDELLTSFSNPEFADAVAAGFATMNYSGTFSEYEFTTETAAINTAIAALSLSADKTIDGDLTDWAGQDYYTVNYRRVENRAANTAGAGKEVSFYAYLGTDGLYVAALAKHQYFRTNAAAWWFNTNLEFFVNGGNQYWTIAYSNKAPMVSRMAVADSGEAGNTRYTTTVEVFIPYSAVPDFVVGTTDMIRIGFAWKTSGDGTGQWDDMWSYKDDNDCWWHETGRTPNNAAEQYYVYSDGIYTAAKPSA
ncbi:MAG: bacterial Ig-like domain-containing protein [Clostridiales bacterium]|jgi:hypothetical protein|nr:bacterial Ig-like domain-containing protein [Clostridiales bacterium]